MAHEEGLAQQWIYEQLHGDAPLLAAAPGDVHARIAPDGTAYPFVTMQFMGGSDLTTHNGTRIWAETLWLVKVTVKANASAALDTVLDRIDALLDRARGVVGTARVYWCQREGIFDQPVVEGGITYLQVGAFYRLKIQKPAAA